MSNQGTIRLKVTNGAPAIEKLWNGRFKLEFLCDNNSPKEDWYYDNISSILPDYGILQDTNFGSGVSEGWEAIPASVYPDMRLVETEYVFIPSMGDKRVKLTYETLTASWVEEKDEDTDYELNGLKRVSRTFVALPGTVYDKVVGTSTIDSSGTTLYLGSFKIEETDAKWSLSEAWLEAGELSREENSEDAKGSISITQIGGCAAAPAGYTVVNESKNNTQGFETCSRTFYRDDSELSRSNDYVGSQLAESIEVFSPTVAPTPTKGTAVLGNKSTSNVDGIPTTRYTFLVPSILSESNDKVGSQLAITIEAFSEVPATPSGYVIANTQVSDVAGIPTERYTFLKEDVELSRSEDKVGSQLAIVIEQFDGTPSTPSGYVIANTQVSDVDGIPTNRYTFLKDNIKLSESEDKVGSQLAKVQEWFNPTTEPTIADYVIASTQVSDIDGIPTKRFTFLKDNVKLSASEDEIGSQNAITEQWFKPSASRDTKANYSLARKEESDVDGIPTERYTFLKDNVELSRSEDKVGSQKAIVTEVFKPSADPTETGYSVARTEVSDVEGMPTKRFTFLKDDVELFHSEDLEGGLNETVEEWFKPNPANNRDEKTDYVLIEKTESDVGGIPTERYTFWKEKGLIDESFVNEAEGVIRTTQVFFSEIDDAKVIGPIVSKDTRNLDGIPTITVQTLQGETGVSIIGEGDRLANDYQQLVSFTYPGLVSIKTNPVGPLYTSYAWRLSPPVECVVEATTYVIFQDSNNIVASDYTYDGASGHWNPTEWAKGESYGLGYGYKPFSESKGFRGYRADSEAIQVYENAPDNYLINGNRLYEDTTGGLNIYGGPEDPSGKKYVLDVKITPAFVDVDGTTNYKKVIVVATIPQQEDTPVPEPDPVPDP